MSARGMNARGLRAFLLVGAVLLGMHSTSYAGTVKLDFQGVRNNGGVFTGGNNTTGPVTRAGQFEFKAVVPGGTSTNFTNGQVVQTFCINVNYGIVDPDTYNLRLDIENLPTPGATMGLTNANKLRILGNEWSLGNLVATVEAVQIAIWKIANGSGVSSTNAAVNIEVTNILNYLTSVVGTYNYAAIQYVAIGLDSLTSGNGQDQIMFTNNPNLIQEVPVPAGVVMAGVGIVCLGGLSYLRRRKVLAAV
ncbi:MAG TPA: hypothetical protein PKD72_12740 [Gemmatales bacterium]|nr:hypothetical protein [Gemmatales bacterium]